MGTVDGTPPAGRGARAHRDIGIVLIAVFKYVKALLLLAVAFGAIGLVRGGLANVSQRLLATFTSGVERRATVAALARIGGLSPRRMEALGVGAFLYAVLFLVEGTGLWLQRRWAEYLTIFATGSFIPFEIYELVRDVTVTRIAALALNVAVVVYLIVRLRQRQHGSAYRK